MTGKMFCRSLMLLLALLLCHCPAAAELPAAVTDDLGREVSVTSADRVAVMTGSFADIWCLAGGRDTIVAAANDSWTSFDLNLPETAANLGSAKSPNVEILLASEPDLVIASSNTSADVALLETLEDAGIPVLYFDVENFTDYLRMLRVCTDITGCDENYELYGTAQASAIAADVARQDGSEPVVLYIRVTGSSASVKGSEGNLLGEMLAEMGCVNAADREGSLLENLSMEAILLADPDDIFVVVQSADADAAASVLEQTLLSDPAWETLRAVRTGHFYLMENELYNLKPNARWAEAYEKLADILYPAA